MLYARNAAFFVAIAACTSTPPPAGPTSQGPAPTPGPAPAPAAFNPALLGANCADGQVCTAGATCVAYFGFAGPRGPEFKTCEIRCAEDKTVCPAGTTCITIADGPGSVCRPTEN